ncbi:MAG: tetratricopeptide repeat protein [Candidatus Marinimicrobia bacterium]|nr:tetratricopeptide repeat protein [Candidatus Neomarinimicrobiota bacterium]
MKYFKYLLFIVLFSSAFAEEDPMGNMTIEYGSHDMLQKEIAYTQGSYVSIEYYENVIIYVQDANILSKNGQIAEAIDKFLIALESDSTYVFALNGLGNAYLKFRDWEKAELYFQKAMKFGPTYAFSYNNLANLYVLQGKNDEALSLLLTAMRYDPNSAYINYNIGNLYLEKEKFAIAQSYFKKALKFDKSFCNARYNLAISNWRMKDEVSAIQEYEALLAQCPGHSKGVLNLAAYYVESRQIEKALILYKQAVLINPDTKVYLALGHAYHNAGYIQKEIDAYQSALQIDSTNIDVKYYLALSYFEQGMTFSAKEICDRVLKIDPSNEMILSILKMIEDEKSFK